MGFFLFAWGVCLVFVLFCFFVLTKPVLWSLLDEELY